MNEPGNLTPAETLITAWMDAKGWQPEDQAEVLEHCRAEPEAHQYFVGRAVEWDEANVMDEPTDARVEP